VSPDVRKSSLRPGWDERVEGGLDRLITKRHDQRAAEQGHRPSEELWQASVERYNAEREIKLRAAWCSYHQDQAARHRRTLEALIARHEEAAAQLMDHEPKGETA
jgi:hypothetical protein